ncbi:RHS repeat-associated core domain-containing protein [Chryseobacterium sp. POE27]|uniref:RHS repeat domain-containing protein n=1 Tax=Chryseobacterium sp. POE27 TaxID=3138177 RepID=UPI00321B55AB
MDWKTASDGIYRRYVYQYDGLNRLTKGIYLTPNLASETQNHFFDEELSYNLNGNIKTLNRYQSPLQSTNTAMQIDELEYEYDNNNFSNKLIRVTDHKNNFSGYPAGGNLITYDVNGNMKDHQDKGISSIIYNYLNLPRQIVSGGGNMSYLYRVDGTKLKKTFGTKTTDYFDGFQYENGQLKLIATGEGTYDYERTQYIYNFTDHLVTYSVADGGGVFYLKENNYYPFGLQHQGYNGYDNLSDFNIPYKNRYNGKELEETGMYDYGARMYMPDIGRWGVMDPLAEKDRRWSPYRYGYDNPMRFMDPDGMFETMFGAWWHRLWNGGGNSTIKFDEKKGEYYYNRLNPSKGNEVNFTGVYGNSARSGGSFVFKIEATGSFGVQLGAKVGGPLSANAEAGIMTTELGKIGWSNREAKNNGFFAKSGDGKGHNFAGVGVKLLSKSVSAGAKVDYVTDDVIPPAGDLLEYYPSNGELDWEGNLGPGKSYWSPKGGSPLDVLNVGLKTKVRASNKESCSFCVDLGIAGKALLGLDIKLQTGFTGQND